MTRSEDTLDGDEARSRLYGAMSADDPLYDRLTDALEIGLDYFGVDYGVVAEIDRETDAWTILVSVDRGAERFVEGREAPLSRTYCRRAIEREEVLAFADADREGLTGDPAFEEWGLSCYHGAAVVVDGEPYGTVCFADDEPRDEPFDEHEKSFSLLIAQMAGYELQQERFEIQLEERDQTMAERRAELATLVDRVFGRTLRQTAAEVDEAATPLRERLTGADAATGQRLVDAGARLAAIGDVAHALDDEDDAPSPDGPLDLVRVGERVARRLEATAPGASVSVETPADPVLTPAPRVGLAVGALAEYAADGTGAVTLSVAVADDRARVRVRGDGLALSNREQSLLTTGGATPNDLDTALWLVNWLVTSADGTVTVPPFADGAVVELVLPLAGE